MPIKLTIFRKGLILVAVPLLFQLALIGLVAEMQRQAVEADRLADHTKEVIAQAEIVQAKLVDLQTGCRGYVLTGNPVFTQPYDRALIEVASAIQQLNTLVSDNPADQAKVADLSAKAFGLIKWYEARHQEVRDGAKEKAVARISSLEGENQMDAIRRDIAAFRLEKERLNDERTLRRDQARRMLLGILIGGAVAALAITVLLAFVFNRGIGGRLAVLASNAGRLAQGQELAAPVGGTDEISDVDRAFRDMARAIQLNVDIVKSVPIGLLIWRLDNLDDVHSLRLVDANPSASGLLGVDVHGMLGKTILQAFPSVTPGLLKAYADVVRSGTPTVIENVHYGDEQVKTNYWSVKAFPLPDCGLGLAFENISARKQAEDAIRRLNEELEQRVEERTAELKKNQEALDVLRRRFDLLLNSAGEGILGLDLNGVTTFGNPAAARMLGWEIEDLVGNLQHALIHHTRPDGSAYPREECPIYRAFLDGDVHRRDDEVFWRKDGTSFPIEYISSPIREDGSVTGAVVVFRDITARKQADEMLRASEERTRLIIDTALDAVITINAEGQITGWNAQAENIFGWPREDAIGQLLHDMIIPLRYREAHQRGMRHFLSTGEGPVLNKRIEITSLHRRGHEFPIELAIAPVQREGKWHFSAFVRDVTERKQAEEQLLMVNRDLEHKNQENEMFVYSVSHDLRSPLVNLQGFSKELGLTCQQLRSLLADDHVPPDVRDRGLALLDQDMAESVQFILTGVTRVSNIIDALLRLSRAGRVEYQMQQVDVNSVVQRVVESMGSTITERGANVTVRELPPICGDPTAVEQVFANLIGNALNYLDPKRPGTIEVGTTNAHDGDGSRTGAWVTYYVKDNGLGIPAAYQHKVFQAFQRVHPEVAKGEGMGLAIVRRAVERHGGKVWVESKAEEGSTFFVALPVSATAGSLK